MPVAGDSSAQSKFVENIFEVMREFLKRLQAKHPSESLERMSRTKESINEFGIDLTLDGSALLIEIRVVLAHLLENLFGLGNKLLLRLGTLARLPATLRHGPLLVLPRPGEQVQHDFPKFFRIEGLEDVSVSAERNAFLTVTL